VYNMDTLVSYERRTCINLVRMSCCTRTSKESKCLRVAVDGKGLREAAKV